MKRPIAVLASALSVVAPFSKVALGQCGFTGIGTQIDVHVGQSSYVRALSGDGNVAVGSIAYQGGKIGFRWTPSEGVVSLCPSNLPCNEATAVSFDGTRIAGESGLLWGYGGVTLAGGLQNAHARGMSADGSMIVGYFGGTQHEQPFDWTIKQGFRHLSWICSTNGYANAVSSDGGVMALSCFSLMGGGWQPVRIEGNNIDGAPLPPGQQLYDRESTAITPDGQTIVGRGRDSGEAFVWRWPSSVIQLGYLLNNATFPVSAARAVNNDGSIVVGDSSSNAEIGIGIGAFVWDQINGTRHLKTVLLNDHDIDLTGWDLISATGISQDGTTIAGYGRNIDHEEGWVVRLPGIATSDPPNGLIDAREDRPTQFNAPSGFDLVVLSFSCPIVDAASLGDLDQSSFQVSNTAGDTLQVSGVSFSEPNEGPYYLSLGSPIKAGEWTTIAALVESSEGMPIGFDPLDRIDIGFLPGDVNGDGVSAADDILAILPTLSGSISKSRPLSSTDMDRSTTVTALDLIRLIDLLNGANSSRAWLGAVLPPRP